MKLTKKQKQFLQELANEFFSIDDDSAVCFQSEDGYDRTIKSLVKRELIEVEEYAQINPSTLKKEYTDYTVCPNENTPILAPCPFCHERKATIQKTHIHHFQVYCDSCDCSGPVAISKDVARAKWNRWRF